ncbi:hypothetical protein [Desulfosporosinus sp.]|uniref:hypothetical protein n=1 Tax=Desulfosporosinus sp. TaxID=157907 RepID=UPI0025C46C9B|nr:hypothetical protein [Desulfosporosinus sp.]
MPRKPRKKSETGIYHVIVRGIGQQDIIHEEDDFQRYLSASETLNPAVFAKPPDNMQWYQGRTH